MQPEPDQPAPEAQQFRIELWPETPTQRWYARVCSVDGHALFESDSPLELVRRLAQWSRTAPPPPGLR